MAIRNHEDSSVPVHRIVYTHTPGPWKIHNNGRRVNRYLAVIDSIPDNEGKFVANCICHVACTNPDADSNAALIADAPELLATLRELVDSADSSQCSKLKNWHESAIKRAIELLDRHGG